MFLKECLKWLTTKGTQANAVFENIIRVHGHRCIREAELYEKPWRDAPEKLVDLVHDVVRSQPTTNNSQPTSSSEEQVDPDDLDGLLSKLSTPLTKWQKCEICTYNFTVALEDLGPHN